MYLCKLWGPVHFNNRKNNLGTINLHDSFILRTLTPKSVRRVRNVNSRSPDVDTESSDVFLTRSDI